MDQTVRPKCYFMRQRLLLQVTRYRPRRWTCTRGVRQICMRINTGNVDRNNIRGWKRLHLSVWVEKEFFGSNDRPLSMVPLQLDASTFDTRHFAVGTYWQVIMNILAWNQGFVICNGKKISFPNCFQIRK